MDDAHIFLDHEPSGPTLVVSGEVKWFDHRRGFGFIVSEACTKDILLHANVLKDFGRSTIVDGVTLQVCVEQAGNGFKVRRIVSIDAPSPPELQLGEMGVVPDAETLQALPMLAARVKWFDIAKGFGFANAFGRSEDIFLHQSVVRAAGMNCFFPGDAIALRMMQGPRGSIAIQVLAWDAAD